MEVFSKVVHILTGDDLMVGGYVKELAVFITRLLDEWKNIKGYLPHILFRQVERDRYGLAER